MCKCRRRHLEKGRDEVSGSGGSPCLIDIRQGPNKLLVYIDNFKGSNMNIITKKSQ